MSRMTYLELVSAALTVGDDLRFEGVENPTWGRGLLGEEVEHLKGAIEEAREAICAQATPHIDPAHLTVWCGERDKLESLVRAYEAGGLPGHAALRDKLIACDARCRPIVEDLPRIGRSDRLERAWFADEGAWWAR